MVEQDFTITEGGTKIRSISEEQVLETWVGSDTTSKEEVTDNYNLIYKEDAVKQSILKSQIRKKLHVNEIKISHEVNSAQTLSQLHQAAP